MFGKALVGAILAAIFIVNTASAQEIKLAQNLSGTQASPAMGGDILNPLPGERILDQQPMIAVKLPTPTPPIDPNTIKLFVDGVDVTSEATVSSEYVFYTSEIPMRLGAHNVLIAYEQICRNHTVAGECADVTGCSWNASSGACETTSPMPPVSWQFVIARQAPAQPDRKPAPGRPTPSLDAKSFTGRYMVKVMNIDINEAARAENGYATEAYNRSDFRYKEGYNTTGSLDFTDRLGPRTIIGHYDRTIEQLRNRANDKFSLNYVDKKSNMTIGDFYMTARNFSQYAISGVQLRGIQLQNSIDKHKITTFVGRSQEPHDGRFYRTTLGVKIDKKHSETHEFRLISLRSKESNFDGAYSYPSSDYINTLSHTLNFNKKLVAETEAAVGRTSKAGDPDPDNSGSDSAINASLTYKGKPFYLKAGRRRAGTNFNPTVLGTFTERDREGGYGEFKFERPSRKLRLSSTFDTYHNNLKHTANNDITDQTRSGRNMLTLNYGWILPQVDLTYNKLYTKSKFELGYPDTQRSESTNQSIRITKEYHDTNLFTGTRLTATFSRYDIDRLAYSGATFDPTLSSVSDYNLRSDSTMWSFATRYKAFMSVSYSNSYNKSDSVSTTSLTTLSDTRTTTDSFAAQFNIVPFKFITNYRYRRSARTTLTSDPITSDMSASSSPIDYEHTVTMVYYLTQKKKVSFEFSDYDKSFRAPANSGRTFDLTTYELGYSVDF
jgi:hypothetical protein